MELQLREQTKKLLLSYQQAEVTGHIIYSRMSKREKDPQNKTVLERIAAEEVGHASIWEKYTGRKAVSYTHLKELDEELRRFDTEMEQLLLRLPNIPVSKLSLIHI